MLTEVKLDVADCFYDDEKHDKRGRVSECHDEHASEEDCDV